MFDIRIVQAAKIAKASGKPVAANPMAKRAGKVAKKAKKGKGKK